MQQPTLIAVENYETEHTPDGDVFVNAQVAIFSDPPAVLYQRTVPLSALQAPLATPIALTLDFNCN